MRRQVSTGYDTFGHCSPCAQDILRHFWAFLGPHTPYYNRQWKRETKQVFLRRIFSIAPRSACNFGVKLRWGQNSTKKLRKNPHFLTQRHNGLRYMSTSVLIHRGEKTQHIRILETVSLRTFLWYGGQLLLLLAANKLPKTKRIFICNKNRVLGRATLRNWKRLTNTAKTKILL